MVGMSGPVVGMSSSTVRSQPSARAKVSALLKQRIVFNKNDGIILMTNDRPKYNLPLVNYNVYWPIIRQLSCMT